jgi:hypothetical protein
LAVCCRYDVTFPTQNDVAREADFYLVQAAGFISSFDNPETAAAEWEGLLQAQMGNKLPDVKALFVRNLGWPASDATTAAAASSFLAGTRCGKTQGMGPTLACTRTRGSPRV